ncbi:excinuclease ABC subunit A [Sphingobacterium allocomposti]|uniref:UvrABC system protein A n=1 Tax=Sphingobacterium allocomposti TaxID=415956 RepID=A0A5S5D812_9SPHI|nr:excinuclease ABC subunit UvrA [Sphingobacterium composti Yoo et al. 2007 non Ten et al. 2007]TYP91815.1 excinuclease ABC subunit A [Sphingobacterium composti Yoo et al. 2007 non Ten et al. 2007]HLS95693.1 excinuclease ABC subunit UvrA [Sphingobacterium sp.]
MSNKSEQNAKSYIQIKGARVNNLKNIDVNIPKNKLVVITGMSGSGKSSLAFDTLYAEGQRRYVESLSSYARQFMGRMHKPEVDYIKGIAPAIAIEQRVITSNPRSTVGTSTEIYDYLKLLYARVGKTISPISGKEVTKDTVSSIIDELMSYPEGTTVTIFAEVIPLNKRKLKEELSLLLQKGFVRVFFEGKIQKVESIIEDTAIKNRDFKAGEVQIVVDRIRLDKQDDTYSRIADSLQTAFFEGKGECDVDIDGHKRHYSDKFELDGMTFEEPTPNFFSFNNPYGACKRCEGYGKVIGIDPDLVIPDKSKSVYDGAIAPWRGEKMGEWLNKLVKNALKFDFPIHRAYADLTKAQQELLWTGNKYFAGLNQFFEELEQQTYKIQYRVMLSRYRGKTDCPECKGSRLRKDASYVKVGGMSITDVVLLPLDEALVFFSNLILTPHEQTIAKRLLSEIVNRIQFLCDVGLSYLTLNRLSNTLSGGESQRINLATSLGSSLVGSIYVLDEPSIGLHPRDTQRLIGVLKSLRDVGNTVIVVEHEQEMMEAADYLIDIGPEAGINGGELVFAGTYDEIIADKKSLTGQYLNGKLTIPTPTQRRRWTDAVIVKGARENNLQGINVAFPLNVFTVVTGVSGSGKTSLVKRILYPALQKAIGHYAGEQTGIFDGLEGDVTRVEQIEMIDQNPIGRSSRSNPVTYVKGWDEIRAVYANLPAAKAAGLKPAAFSFNVEGGRCDVCQGDGEVKIEMQFMADIILPCEACGGKRFKQHVLDVAYKGKSVADVLDLSVDEAIEFFSDQPKIIAKIKPLQDVGLGYVKLGQPSSTLSGGEAQRIKLASFLIKGNNSKKTLFIFDEPTTGLHFHDIHKLIKAFDALIALGNSILVIEHNMEMIKTADWVIDIGPEGGNKGGRLVFEGTPEDLTDCNESYTGKFLKNHLHLSPRS